jgi:hypothetical protein
MLIRSASTGRFAGNCGKALVVRQFGVVILVGRRIAGGG